MPRLHERVEVTERAANDVRNLLLVWLQRNDLTWGEAIRILAYELAHFTKYPIRQERHPDDPEKKADEA
jgi:hypothetical protein